MREGEREQERERDSKDIIRSWEEQLYHLGVGRLPTLLLHRRQLENQWGGIWCISQTQASSLHRSSPGWKGYFTMWTSIGHKDQSLTSIGLYLLLGYCNVFLLYLPHSISFMYGDTPLTMIVSLLYTKLLHILEYTQCWIF